MNLSVSYATAFGAGLLSFLSPCVLPLLPAYFSFITGYSIDELTRSPGSRIRVEVFISTLLFVAGFSFIFIAMGASATAFGNLAASYREYIRIIGGILIIIFGIHLCGLLRIRFFDFERRFHMKSRPVAKLGAFLIGMAFGAGWSPCVGPMLASILILAGSKESVWQGISLLSVYSAGLAAPFIILSIFIQFLLTGLQRARKWLPYINKAAGILLIAVGLMLVTDSFSYLGILLYQLQ